MKILSFIKQSSFGNSHPQEDFFAVSKNYPIFVVADGVSLNFDDDKNYPNHSGAGEAAKIFCETVILEAERRYKNFDESNLKDIFELGNKAVLEYNISQGRTKNTINYWDVDLFSATTSFLLIKDSKAYWWTLCDSGIALFNKNGKQLFISLNVWIMLEKFIPKNLKKITGKERFKMLHKDYRNAVDENGRPVGYGVVTGEEAAKYYLNCGEADLNVGDLIFVYTDGFENYFNLKEFKDLFNLWPDDISSQLENIIADRSKTELAKYGSEKTLIAISI